MQVSIPYGHGALTFECDDDAAVTVLSPRRDEADPVRLALAAPIGSPRLRDLARPGQSVAIVTSDITRPCPTGRLLPPVLDELTAAGVPLEDVLVVFGLGTHRPHTADERRMLMGPAYGRVRCVDSNPDDTVLAGVTTSGTPIEAFRPVVAADFRVALGCVEYHYFAGFSGGAKALVPGVCSARTIRHNHARMCEAGACLGRLDGNPVRADIEEGAGLIGLDFILNVVMAEHKIAFAAAGHPVHAHRWACAALDYTSMTEIPCCSDIVIVGAGGYPKDINLYQAQKALDNAAAAVRPGGVIIWVAQCGEGFGNRTFEQWIVGSAPEEILRRIRAQFVLGGHKAAAIARVLERAEVWLVSDLPAEVVAACNLRPFTSLAEALDAARARERSLSGGEASIVVMPEGAAIVPGVRAGVIPERPGVAGEDAWKVLA